MPGPVEPVTSVAALTVAEAPEPWVTARMPPVEPETVPVMSTFTLPPGLSAPVSWLSA